MKMAYRKNNKKHQRGFTLIEVIAVLVIIAVLAAVVISRMTSPSSFGLVSETDILKGHLRYAQYRAMSHTETWGMQFSTNGYSLLYNKVATTSKLPNEDSSTHTFSPGITISAGAEPAVHFNERGSPVGDGDALLTAETEIVLSDGSTERRVKITQNTGFIP